FQGLIRASKCPGFARQGPKNVSIQVQTNPWQSNVVRQLSVGGVKEERLFGSITLGRLALRAALGDGSCISSQAHSKFGHLRLRGPWHPNEFMLAAIARNIRALARKPARR